MPGSSYLTALVAFAPSRSSRPRTGRRLDNLRRWGDASGLWEPGHSDGSRRCDLGSDSDLLLVVSQSLDTITKADSLRPSRSELCFRLLEISRAPPRLTRFCFLVLSSFFSFFVSGMTMTSFPQAATFLETPTAWRCRL